MTWFEAPLLVMHNFVSKKEHWLAAGSDYFGALGLSNYGVENDPFLYYAEGQVLVMFSSSEEHIFKGQLRTNQGNPIFAQQPVFEPFYHPVRPANNFT